MIEEGEWRVAVHEDAVCYCCQDESNEHEEDPGSCEPLVLVDAAVLVLQTWLGVVCRANAYLGFRFALGRHLTAVWYQACSARLRIMNKAAWKMRRCTAQFLKGNFHFGVYI